MKQEAASPYTITAVARALHLLELFTPSTPELDLMTLSKRAGLPKSSTFRYLSVLEELGYVARDATRNTYYVTLKLFQLGQAALSRLDIRDVARPVMQELADQYQETINLGVLNDHHVVLIEVIESPRSIRMGSVLGDIDRLHSTAIGKAIMAHQPAELVGTLAELGLLARFTPKTITDAAALGRELAEIRERGYSLDDEETEIGQRCVAVPIFDRRGEARYGLSMAAPTARLPLERAHELGGAIVGQGARISSALGAPAPDMEIE
jgi:IclR family acetate operon transcriptional repressor